MKTKHQSQDSLICEIIFQEANILSYIFVWLCFSWVESLRVDGAEVLGGLELVDNSSTSRSFKVNPGPRKYNRGDISSPPPLNPNSIGLLFDQI